ncbi:MULTISPECIES: FtsX-like permease family protein [Terrabacteria group]|uniref:FtsX-like permease family protein n=1 Tax=Bacillati TaxID=1783272 RepID=UPI001C6E326C|nr:MULTISPECIES: FtsX-like permease family protein [Terrabacteria group]MBW9211896.1 FtsX-like permease family protein [Trueperella sp. zg.1013]
MVKAKTFWKSLGRLILKTKGRYINLVAIVAIGVAFFVGVSSSAGIMAHSVSSYNQRYKLKQATIYSNYGFEQEDVDKIAKQAEIKQSEASYFEDAQVLSNHETRITRIHSYNPKKSINQFELVEGRMPENNQEVLAEKGSSIMPGFKLGDALRLEKKDTILKVKQFKVVGLVKTPLYLNQMKENSTLQNQEISTYLYLQEDGFKSDRYREVNLIFKGNFDTNEFSKDYQNQLDKIQETLKPKLMKLGKEEGNRVKESALKDYQSGLDTYQKEKMKFKDKKQAVNQKLNEAKEKLEKSEKEINQGKVQLDNAKHDLIKQEETLKQKEKETKEKIQISYQKLQAKKFFSSKQLQSLCKQKETLLKQNEELIKQKGQVEQVKPILNQLEGLEQLIHLISSEQAIWSSYPDETIVATIPTIHSDQYGFDTQQNVASLKAYLAQLLQQKQRILNELKFLNGNKVSEKKADLKQKLSQIEQGLKQIESGLEQIKEGSQKIQTGLQTLEQAFKTIQAEKIKGTSQFNLARKKLNQAKKTLRQKEVQWKDGHVKLQSAKKKYQEVRKESQEKLVDGERKLKEAKYKLVDAKKEINRLEDGEWIYVDRCRHYASITFRNTVDQMKAIARIFPVFFILIAMLVCLTTMTRLVEEDRSELGTFRALGYQRKRLFQKYACYSLSATGLGLILGVLIGMASFPFIIYEAWKMMFILPKIQMEISWLFITRTVVGFFVVMYGTTWFAVQRDTKEMPASLMRPKAPKIGKTILLERIPCLWKRLSFLHKVTFRNLIRYKKRFFMSIIGIAGCSALMVMGFGIRDSITSLVNLQFKKILHYDGVVEAKDDVNTLKLDLEKDSDIAYVKEGLSFNTSISYKGKEKSASLYSGLHLETLYQLEDLHRQKISFQEDGLIISEKVAQQLGAREGDVVTIENAVGKKFEVPIRKIVVYYVQHGIWMNPATYEKIFHEKVVENSAFVKVKKNVSVADLEKKLLQRMDVKKIEFFRPQIENFNQMILGLDAIVWVLIASSMLLAFVVLQNLISLNISERIREIATLKVLGFRKREIERYVFQENILLTALASLVGLPIGILLHRAIMTTIQVENITFPIQIHWLSFVYAFLWTALFGLAVTRWMRKYIHRIDMVESLKSLE